MRAVTGCRIILLDAKESHRIADNGWVGLDPHPTRRSPPKVQCHPTETEMIIESKVAVETIDWWDSSSAPAVQRNPVARPLSPSTHTNPNTLNRVSELPAANEFAAEPSTQPLLAPCRRLRRAANHDRRSPPKVPCHAPETGMIIESEILPKYNYRKNNCRDRPPVAVNRRRPPR